MSNSNSTVPNYYRRGRVIVWDFIRDQGLNFHLGNAIKYICRAGHKESAVTDLKKAIHYLQNELENLESTNPPDNATHKPVFKPNPIFEPPVFGNPSLTWGTGTDIQDSDGFSPGEAG